MDRSERFYMIDMLLNRKTAVPLTRFIEELEVSRSTVKRDIEYLRDRLNAPIVWDHSLRGYRYGTQGEGFPLFCPRRNQRDKTPLRKSPGGFAIPA